MQIKSKLFRAMVISLLFLAELSAYALLFLVERSTYGEKSPQQGIFHLATPHPLTSLSYSQDNAVYPLGVGYPSGKTIVSTPSSNNGGAMTHDSVSPMLPASSSLNENENTGVSSSAPSPITGKTHYTATAENGSFDDAFNALIGNEGNYANNPADPGGETMWGITARVARAWGYQGDMRDLPRDTAKQIAKSEYWDRYQCDQFDPHIGFQIFDAAYNGGPAAHWLQMAAGVPIDGIIGPQTITAVRALDPDKIILRFDAYRLQYLSSLPIWPVFGHGWVNRIANDFLESAQ